MQQGRRYPRTAQRISSGSVCRHLKIAGRIVFFMISSGYQPPLAKVATQPIETIPDDSAPARRGFTPADAGTRWPGARE